MKITSTTGVLGALSAAAVALLVVSGIPAFKDAESGWKHVVGDLSWGGFLVAATALVALSVTAIVRRRRAAV